MKGYNQLLGEMIARKRQAMLASQSSRGRTQVQPGSSMETPSLQPMERRGPITISSGMGTGIPIGGGMSISTPKIDKWLQRIKILAALFGG